MTDEITFEQVRSDLHDLTFQVSGFQKGHDLEPPDLSFERIVVGVDASEHADDAVAWANTLAQRTDAHVWLVHVAPSASFAGPYETRGWVNAEAYSRRLEGEAAELLEDAADAMDDRLNVDTRLVHGSPAHQLGTVAKDVDADLIVVGSHEHSTAGRLLLGSTADALKDRTEASLLVARDAPPVERILVPTDGSEPSTRAAAIALELARQWKAHIDLLHVFPLPLYTLDEGTEAIEEAFFGKALAWDHPQLDREIRFGDDVAEEILDAAGTREVDLIVMGRRGLGPWRGRVAGSVSRGVLHGAETSVLLVRARDDVD